MAIEIGVPAIKARKLIQAIQGNSVKPAEEAKPAQEPAKGDTAPPALAPQPPVNANAGGGPVVVSVTTMLHFYAAALARVPHAACGVPHAACGVPHAACGVQSRACQRASRCAWPRRHNDSELSELAVCSQIPNASAPLTVNDMRGGMNGPPPHTHGGQETITEVVMT